MRRRKHLEAADENEEVMFDRYSNLQLCDALLSFRSR